MSDNKTPVVVLTLGREPKIDSWAEAAIVVDEAQLVSAVVRHTATSAVIVVVDNDAQANRALGLGADEVVRSDASEAIVQQATARALLRARARFAQRGVDSSPLMNLVEQAVRSVVLDAAASCQVVRLGLDPVVQLADEYTNWAMKGQPGNDQARDPLHIVARRAGAPSSGRLQEAAGSITSALRDVAQTIQFASELFPAFEDQPQCESSSVVRAVCGVARFIVEPYGRFRALISTERHHVAISRAELANVVSVLLARAADSISKEPGDESTVWISTRANGDSLLLRVVDTGDGPRWPSAEQDDLVHRVRRAGGDVMLDRELGRGTTARVFLPLLDDC